jgi:P27 family predicted phage terminase small subunit
MKGRKKLPDRVKKAHGEKRPCRLSGDIELYKKIKLPEPPKWMNETGKKIYKDVVGKMIELGLVHSNNLMLIVSFVHLIGVHFEMEEMMKAKTRLSPVKDGGGNLLRINVSPFHRISMDALDRALRIGAEFGLTPSAQSRIMNMIKKPEEKNAFEDI